MPCIAWRGSLDLLALQRAFPTQFPHVCYTGAQQQGWHILFALPQASQTAHDAASALTCLHTWDEAWHQVNETVAQDIPAFLPFRGGWFAYAAYELLHAFEPSVKPSHALPIDLPLLVIQAIPAAIVQSADRQQTWLIAQTAHQMTLLSQLIAAAPQTPLATPLILGELHEDDPACFLTGVERIHDYIRAGDSFQVNLSRQWEITCESSAAAVFTHLQQANPAPFSALANFGHWQIISTSPERLFAVQGERVVTRPIAGTHRRDPDPLADAQLRTQLLASGKERAEHVMLVDLERNDLGRICQPGSVRVDDLMGVHTYAFVHHIESIVSGQLAPQYRQPSALLRALFPGGTITGCPKVRTMQIIAELETAPRLAYTGSLGYLNYNGEGDFNILIRSFLAHQGKLIFRAGAGIVADSQATRELAETRIKAKGLLRALGYDT